eukprot:CAMPEP_0202890704 /NCGR_PEP_ID=MMETSP1392-20130828/1019_1 /ASSEMBLY_ACC=CAM_ASM_000868 /TAXON_ID=225041 /ORGANISM="Chlamydomonas chlamydogama, Strain SAG 11-48b" /LENGTH=527 /DNA_ID=CAMNT_0049574321 /DNA_START=258 /DNA_END=1841 /DNA_ORIENTATION=+
MQHTWPRQAEACSSIRRAPTAGVTLLPGSSDLQQDRECTANWEAFETKDLFKVSTGSTAAKCQEIIMKLEAAMYAREVAPAPTYPSSSCQSRGKRPAWRQGLPAEDEMGELTIKRRRCTGCDGVSNPVAEESLSQRPPGSVFALELRCTEGSTISCLEPWTTAGCTVVDEVSSTSHQCVQVSCTSASSEAIWYRCGENDSLQPTACDSRLLLASLQPCGHRQSSSSHGHSENATTMLGISPNSMCESFTPFLFSSSCCNSATSSAQMPVQASMPFIPEGQQLTVLNQHMWCPSPSTAWSCEDQLVLQLQQQQQDKSLHHPMTEHADIQLCTNLDQLAAAALTALQPGGPLHAANMALCAWQQPTTCMAYASVPCMPRFMATEYAQAMQHVSAAAAVAAAQPPVLPLLMQPLRSVSVHDTLASCAKHLMFNAPYTMRLALHCWQRIERSPVLELVPSHVRNVHAAVLLWMCAKLEEGRKGLPPASQMACLLGLQSPRSILHLELKVMALLDWSPYRDFNVEDELLMYL